MDAEGFASQPELGRGEGGLDVALELAQALDVKVPHAPADDDLGKPPERDGQGDVHAPASRT